MTETKSARILLAEDDRNLRIMTTDLLEMFGYSVEAVDRGQLAIEAFDRGTPDLVLADISMPDGDGYFLLRHIRSHPTASDVPVIFLTGKAGLTEIRAGLRDGVDDFITKPFDPDELLRSIAQRIERRARQRQRLENLKILLSASLPYELRTPLCGILGYAELLRDSASAGEAIPAADVAEAAQAQLISCESLLRVIDAVAIWIEVSSSTAELAGQYARARTAGWVATIAQDSREIARRHGREASLELRLDEGVVAVPAGHWRMLVAQLVDNAFKYSPKGSPVRVTGTVDGQRYRLLVHDIAPCPEITETGSLSPFQEKPASSSTAVRGLGLGVAIVRQIAALSGGEFSLGRAEDGGTSASVVVPLSRREETMGTRS